MNQSLLQYAIDSFGPKIVETLVYAEEADVGVRVLAADGDSVHQLDCYMSSDSIYGSARYRNFEFNTTASVGTQSISPATTSSYLGNWSPVIFQEVYSIAGWVQRQETAKEIINYKFYGVAGSPLRLISADLTIGDSDNKCLLTNIVDTTSAELVQNVPIIDFSAINMRDMRLVPQTTREHTVNVWCCECLQGRPDNYRLITDVKIPQRDIHRYCDDKFHMQKSIEIPTIFSKKVGDALVELLGLGAFEGEPTLDLGPEDTIQLLQVMSYLGIKAAVD